MIYSFIYDPRALDEYEDAYEWYFAHSEEVSENFRLTLLKQIQQICTFPKMYRNTRKQFREVTLK